MAMTGHQIDPAMFRLRRFEVEWLEPLIKTLGSLDRFELRDGGVRALSYTLLAEASRWVSLGEKIGYFAHDSEAANGVAAKLASPPDGPGVERVIRRIANVPASQRLGIWDFASALDLAREDLTPQRREFLRLVCFASQEEWDSRLRVVAQTASAIAAHHHRRHPRAFPDPARPTVLDDGIHRVASFAVAGPLSWSAQATAESRRS
jgi:hypothetical protein